MPKNFNAKKAFEYLSIDELKKRAGIPADLPLTAEVFNKYKKELFAAVGIDHVPTDPKQIPVAVANYFLEKFDLPTIPKLDTKSIVNAGLQLASTLDASLPFPLPSKIPTDLTDVIDYALQTAWAIYGPQILAAAGMGSVVPGIGNVVAFMYAAIDTLITIQNDKDLRYALSDHPFYPCRLHGDIKKNPFGNPCQNVRNISAIPMEAEINTATMMLSQATRQFLMNHARLKDQERFPIQPSCSGVKSGTYDHAQILQCFTNEKFFIKRNFPMVRDSVAVAPLSMVNHALMIFDEAQAVINDNNFFSDVVGQGRTSYIPRPEQESVWLIDSLKIRKNSLEKLAVDAIRIANEPPSGDAFTSAKRIGALSSMKERVMEEVRRSAVSVQLAGITTTGGVTAGQRGASKYWVEKNTADFARWLSIQSKLIEVSNLEDARYKRFKDALDKKEADRAERERLAEERKLKANRDAKRRRRQKRRRLKREKERREQEAEERALAREIARRKRKSSKKDTSAGAGTVVATVGGAALLWKLLLLR